MTTRICPECGVEKSLDRFTKPTWQCKDCINRKTVEWRRNKRAAYLAEHPKAVKTSKACKICGVDKPFEDFYFANRAKGIRSSYCKRCQMKVGNAQRTSKPTGRIREKCTRIRTTVEWYYRQLEAQRNLCALCGEPETQPVRRGGKVRNLAIDHDHETGKVRELLCFRCNTALHQIEKHGHGWASRAVAYLVRHGAVET